MFLFVFGRFLEILMRFRIRIFVLVDVMLVYMFVMFLCAVISASVIVVSVVVWFM